MFQRGRPNHILRLGSFVLATTIGLAGCSSHQPAASKGEDDGSLWWKHIEYLASDDLKGRYTGSEGYKKAADYMVTQFQAVGLEPAGTNGYLQPIEFETRRVIAEKSSFDLIAGGKTTALKVPSQVALAAAGESGKIVTAPMVFTGYGLTVPEDHYDDFAGVKTRGAIGVRLAGGAPRSVAPLLAAYYGSNEVARKRAAQVGLIGGVGLVNPKVIDLPWPRLINTAMTTELRPEPPTIDDSGWTRKLGGLISPEAADKILAGTGHTLDELVKLNQEGKPLPHLALRAKLRAKVTYESGKVESPNVLAMIPGNDPALKDQYVLISAHLDHIGIGLPVNGDAIYNGAMDNASGVATLIETARLIKSGAAPKRSILFLACTGEEEGELGSEVYAAEPTVPLHNIVADINLDMYLPLFPLKILRAYGLKESDLANYVEAAAQENGIRVQDDPHPEENIFIRSDQYS
ncbi:MAG: M28 family peptidase, partial [Bryobacteraceae bacterium]